MDNKLSSDLVFLGLTRPTMIFGVSMQYAMVNLMLSITIYIQGPSLYVLIIAAIAHLVGYILCFTEPRFIELYINYANKCNQCPNKSYYGANSYAV
ncbi:VirB3 family type IV secretion system protein [Rickettsia endosymbiont of Cardiosporidium cionae]|uniref:VirB3 family type IV secretion system protein n=1 Tax=Rickettsia endosymbiont of Cardiosporidium cionae TaxID=2777155 RepID=UPI0018959A6E|nr:VirB3 family type IV secretion system protein [Rickettsia endosymbiont of Cardiosporidium cionae]KAF8818860.1 type IV secretion system protein VirB3 [Rickettsia endosymbiont of Cardiosporidium cionae]